MDNQLTIVKKTRDNPKLCHDGYFYIIEPKTQKKSNPILQYFEKYFIVQESIKRPGFRTVFLPY